MRVSGIITTNPSMDVVSSNAPSSHGGLPYQSAYDRRHFVALLGLSTLALGTGGCQLLGLQWRYRYRLTAEIESGGEVYSGSSVIEVTRDKGYTGINGRARGEAVAVDIPGARTVFILLRGNLGGVDWPFTMPHRAFAAQLGGVNMVDPKILDRLTRLEGVTSVLTPDIYPMFVRFRDIRDPATVEEIDPLDLAKTFGKSTRLLKVTATITSDGVTSGIEKKFGWFDSYLARHFDGSSNVSEDMTASNIAAHLSSLSFSTEFKQ